MWFKITPHRVNQTPATAVTQLLTALHQTGHSSPIALAIVGAGDGTQLQADVPPELRSLFTANARDLLPDCRVDHIPPSDQPIRPVRHVLVLRLQPECFSIAADQAHATSLDRATGLFSALRTGKAGAIETRLTITIRPVDSVRREKTKRLIQRLQHRPKWGFARKRYERWIVTQRWLPSFAADTMRRVLPCSFFSVVGVEEKLRKHLYECVISIEVAGPQGADRLIQAKLVDIAGSLGAFTTNECRFEIVKVFRKPALNWRLSSVLNPAELSEIWHAPMGDNRVAGLSRAPVIELEPPTNVPPALMKRATVIGKVLYRNQKQKASLSPDARMRHSLVIGKTGCGKSTLLNNMIVDDLNHDRSICVLDPHGELIDSVLDFVPKRRTNDVLLFDAADRQQPIGFNPLATGGRMDPILVADGVLTAFQNVFGFDAAAAPRLIHIFRNCLLALITPADQYSLIAVQRMLTDESFRKQVVPQVENPAVRQFWTDEFGKWRPADRTAFVASLQNKLGAYLSNPLLTGIFVQSKNTLDFRSLMDNGRNIVLINLSKGRMGADASRLLGSLIVSSLQTAALSRADLAESDRRDFYVYLDEFSHFVAEGNDTFAMILSESRKYRTGYTLVTQFIDQLDSQTRAAVFGNCGNLVTMQCGIDDARLMADQLGFGVSPQAIAELPRFHAYARTIQDGMPSGPYAIATPPPLKNRLGRAAIVRNHSRNRNGVPLAKVQAMIKEAYGQRL